VGVRYHRGKLPNFEHPWAIYAVAFNITEPRRLSPAARDLVMDAILFWQHKRYVLFAACVMPDHVHMLIQPMPMPRPAGADVEFWALGEIMHSIKSWTAHEINKLEGESGTLWQKEWFDRYVRGDRDLEEKYRYILNNPQADGIVEHAEDYPWCWWEGGGWRRGHGTDAAFAAGRREQHASRVLHPGADSPQSDVSGGDAQAGRLCSPMQGLPETEPHIFIGTHALLYEGAGFSRLGLVVIDEQHKFGVMQRARLREQGTVPDVLVMTATPIPRTLTMTLYGDLDVSTLDEMPAGRGRIVTVVRSVEKLPDAVKFIRTQLDEGRQAYVVYPLVEESERLEAKAATAEFAKWRELLAPMQCGLLHGRVPPEEKDAVMTAFRRGETKALIATTVIEVGIDVPNANIMLIENAERFGLAQIHQLRGRIGRGAHKSYCVLLTTGNDPEVLEKLHILEKTNDGFEIAEADLRLRGPGDLLGTAQSGLAPLRLGDLFKDADLMKLARNHAFLIFERDPKLELPENAGCRTLLAENRRAILSQVS
jgi:REP element-mobilizing transposase RayT